MHNFISSVSLEDENGVSRSRYIQVSKISHENASERQILEHYWTVRQGQSEYLHAIQPYYYCQGVSGLVKNLQCKDVVSN
jgi:hypothetical protein